MTTFKLNDTVYALTPKFQTEHDTLRLIKEERSPLIFNRANDKKLLRAQTGNGVLDSMFYAYNTHINLVLRPDDIFSTIRLVMARVLQKNPRILREKCDLPTNFPKPTMFTQTTSMNLSDSDYTHMTQQFTEFTNKYPKISTLIDQYTPRFSTTTPIDIFINHLAIMNTFDQLYNYQIEDLCGIPSVTLLGTKEDWIALRDGCIFVKEFSHISDHFNIWHAALHLTLNKFIDAFDGNIDTIFWNKMCVYKHIGTSEWCNGGDGIIAGWAFVFSPFHDNKFVLSSMENIYIGVAPREKIYGCYVSVPVVFKLPNGDIYDCKIHGGSFGAKLDETVESTKPSPSINPSWNVFICGNLLQDGRGIKYISSNNGESSNFIPAKKNITQDDIYNLLNGIENTKKSLEKEKIKEEEEMKKQNNMKNQNEVSEDIDVNIDKFLAQLNKTKEILKANDESDQEIKLNSDMNEKESNINIEELLGQLNKSREDLEKRKNEGK